MRLQRLELSGFKSFSDRSELAFDRGVTAIVGPNGCGKSNVVDAIAWVLGEQSAKSLRGDRMEDVIFSGSDVRKPTAAAEVRLLLGGARRPGNGNGYQIALGSGNGGGHGHSGGHGGRATLEAPEDIPLTREVEVTRRLFRSGESEYLIDGEVCRLRDVHDLFMDNGVGTKAYAIIEQGKIAAILNARPIDRRQIIEEAAGVTKYKTRRRAAELKLEAARQNLTRIDDIVFEIEKQRGALRRQAAKARRYRRLREELRRWEKILFVRRYRVLAAVIESTRERLAAAREREAIAAARLAGLETGLDRTRIDLTEAESRAAHVRDVAHARELEIGQRQHQIEFDRQQIQALGERAEELASAQKALDARREPASREVAERHEAAARAENERARAAEQFVSAERAQSKASGGLQGFEADVEAARSEVFAAMNAATALHHAIEHSQIAQERVIEEISRLDVEAADLGREMERVDRERAAASDERARSRTSIEETRAALTARSAEFARARETHGERVRELRAAEQELAGLTARLQSLEELEAGRAGYGDAARLVLAESNGDIAHGGAVADHLEVDPGYERAAEALLDDLLQYVVVERLEHAEAGLRFVREKSAGRCGFLVVDGAKGRPGAAGRPAGAGLRPLGAVVRVSGPHAAAIRETLGDMWVAESMAAAERAASLQPAPVATLEGDVFRGLSLVWGGGRDEGLGILAAKREIREVRDRRVAERAAAESLASDVARLEARAAGAGEAIAVLTEQLHEQEKSLVSLELRLARAGEEAERIARRRDLVATERRRAGGELDRLNGRTAEAEASIVRLEADQREGDERLAQAQRRLAGARENVESLARQVAEAKAAHAALVERSAGLAAEVRRVEEAASELDARAAAAEAEWRQAVDHRRELEAQIVENQRLLDEDVAALQQLRVDLLTAEERVASLHAEIADEEAAVRSARREIEAVRSVVGEHDIARAKAESDLTHLATSCLDTLQAALDDITAEVEQLERDGVVAPDVRVLGAEEEAEELADATAEPQEPAEEQTPDAQRAVTAEEIIAQLRARIDRLGPVNMMAIEQFDDLDQRYGFLTGQRQDLIESIAATGDAIKKIDETTKQRFREALDAINTNFQQTFSTVFGGGRAGLTLLDESDLLESGIDIIAQPPGKRLQNVNLLSGGEKALTVMALMFAIFRYKPSPFCLLDEIDAPLDDANIGRFIEMLRGLQSDTQFILITHNRKTMEIADRLYGVTMEEPGVSKVISVRLN